jgi:molybdate transport system regulatory protein
MISSQQNAGLILPNTKLTFRILQNDEIAMGPGKAELLQAIADTGSISAAGRSMRMSYRRAWLLVDVMNRSFKQPLVETSKSGKKGRGAGLTPFGKQVLKNYQTTVRAINHTIQAYLPLFAGMLAENAPQQPADENSGG